MSETEERSETGRVRPFADLLRDHRGGALHDEISEKVQDIAHAVLTTRGTGTLQITIKIEPAKGNGQVIVTDKIKTKVPEERGGSYFFVDRDGALVRDDPNQLAFSSLREVKGDDGTVREVDPNTGEVLREVAAD